MYHGALSIRTKDCHPLVIRKSRLCTFIRAYGPAGRLDSAESAEMERALLDELRASGEFTSFASKLQFLASLSAGDIGDYLPEQAD